MDRLRWPLPEFVGELNIDVVDMAGEIRLLQILQYSVAGTQAPALPDVARAANFPYSVSAHSSAHDLGIWR
jgi:hypothetical protein